MDKKEFALKQHEEWQGKLEIACRAKVKTPEDLAVAYTPGVAEPCKVIAKNKEAAADLSRQIKTKLADKYYYAMTDGVPEKKKGTLEDELLQNGKTNTSEVVERGTPQAKHASLSYEVVEQDGKHAVLRIKLDTGRHHQIRVQLAHAGMPIVGDKKYNFKENIAPSGGQLALCSFKIAFRHPKTHRKLEFEIDKPFGLS